MKKVRLRTILFVFLFITLTVNIVIVILREDTANMSFITAIESNKLIITGLDYGYLNEENSFIRIISDLAYADIIANRFKLEDIDISFKNNKIKVDAEAERGSYTINKILEATGNLNGSLNDLDFTTKKDGNIVYNYETSKGSILNGLEVKQGKNMIYSDSVFFDSVNDFFYFKDNVVVNYSEPVILSNSDNATLDVDNATLDSDNTTIDVGNTISDSNNATIDSDSTTLDVDNATLDSDNTTLDVDNATSDSDSTTLDVDNATLDSNDVALNGDNVTLNE